MELYTRRTAIAMGASLSLVGCGNVPGLQLVTNLIADDPLFNGRSMGEVYVATSRVIHLTTDGIGRGIASAAKAVKIRDDKDIPAYLNDLETTNMPNSFTGQIKERNAEIVEFSSEASEDIKEKLKSGFSLSDEAKIELNKAYSSLAISEIFQTKAVKGSIKFGGQLSAYSDPASAVLPLFDALKLDLDITQFIGAITSFATDVTSLFSNVGGIYEVKEAISTAEDMKGVELAKAELLNDTVDQTIKESVGIDLEQFAT